MNVNCQGCAALRSEVEGMAKGKMDTIIMAALGTLALPTLLEQLEYHSYPKPPWSHNGVSD